MKKVLLINDYPTNGYGLLDFYSSAFTNLGFTVKLISLNTKYSLSDRVRLKLSKYVETGFNPDWDSINTILIAKEFKPDIVIVCRCERLTAKIIYELNLISKYGCINIYPDSPIVIPGNGIYRIESSFAEYKKIFTFSKSLIPVFYQLGATNVGWLPFAHSPFHHNINNKISNNFLSDIAYLGSWGRIQENWINLTKNLYTMRIYGPGWKRSECLFSKISYLPDEGIGRRMSFAIQNSKVIFNLVRAEHGCAHSMKTFEIPACGGFMLSNWTEEQSMFFLDEVQCVYFNSQDDYLSKLNFYIKNDTVRDRIIINGFNEVKKHTYEKRVLSILRDLKMEL